MEMKVIEGSKDTFKSFVINLLVAHGLWKDEAETILLEIQEKMKDTMQNRWGDSLNGHPEVTVKWLTVTAKKYALIWLDKTNPDHFARYMLGAPIPDNLPE